MPGAGARACVARETRAGWLSALVLLGSALLLAGCRQEHVVVDARPARCDAITDVAGQYRCSGECIVTEKQQRTVLKVPEETDTVQRYPGASAELYQVEIAAPGFSELEIGALVGDTLRTATAAVTGDQYPVLEEYVFEGDATCRARAFAKIVRNPSQDNFKSCLIRCQKSE